MPLIPGGEEVNSDGHPMTIDRTSNFSYRSTHFEGWSEKEIEDRIKLSRDEQAHERALRDEHGANVDLLSLEQESARREIIRRALVKFVESLEIPAGVIVNRMNFDIGGSPYVSIGPADYTGITLYGRWRGKMKLILLYHQKNRKGETIAISKALAPVKAAIARISP